MKKLFSAITVIVVILFNISIAQDFTGSYFIQTKSGGVTLTLQDDGQGGYSGKFIGNGNTFLLIGTAQRGVLMGQVGEAEDGILFQAELTGSYLTLTMVQTDENQNPLPGSAQTFMFQRQPEGDNGSQDNPDANKEQVVINNSVLSPQQISEIENKYGRKPQPGKYWYDANCGLYGVVGYPAFGFMNAGHNFGQLDRNASNGHTGVIINGRELPQSEWAVWSYMLGYWIQQGSYWLDQNGNAGYQGNPTPIINLYAAARQNAYKGKGGSGDNFWSSRFGAGNYDSGNQRGYVSVPGYGPVGYGF